MKTTYQFTLSALSAALFLAIGAAQAATIVIQSRDPAGVGFNDPTVVLPVGGNAGTTLGQQRLNVYRRAADIWEANLTSNVNIVVSAGWEALTCNAGSAVLGSAGAWNVWRSQDVAGLPLANTWYPQALANKLVGFDIPTAVGQVDDGSGFGNVDIKTQFNVNLGNANCLAGRTFYLGLDGNAGNNVNFLTTLLHELGHGLGFSLLTTSSASGARFDSSPSVWEGFMYDNTAAKTWLQMTDAERAASAINPRKLGWNGANAVAGVPQVLAAGTTSTVTVGGPAAGPTAGNKVHGAASFGPPLNPSPVAADLMPVVDQAIGGLGLACNPLSATNAAAVSGRIALIDRGTCTFVVKVKNAQNAGAKGVLIADNVVAGISGLGGTDATITIPSVRILKVDGDALKLRLKTRSRGSSGVYVTMVAPLNGLYAGADAGGRPLLYTPNPREPGSSVSHFDVTATPNQLMEPFINADLTTTVKPPKDLTLPLLLDLGWTAP